jgi:hypothetical protein
MNLSKLLYKIYLRSPENLFDEFIIECQKVYNEPAHTLVELRLRDNKKVRGDIFEEFCVLYLKHVKNYKNVWLLKDVPDNILEKLSLKRQDMGIDIIIENDDVFSAVQCKYKSPIKDKKSCITWKILSTFYALCMHSGPWLKHIVMTNCNYVRHAGKKTEKDISFILSTFKNIKKEDWLKMCLLEKSIENDTKESPLTITKEELRLKRLEYFSNKNINL